MLNRSYYEADDRIKCDPMRLNNFQSLFERLATWRAHTLATAQEVINFMHF